MGAEEFGVIQSAAFRPALRDENKRRTCAFLVTFY